MANTKKRNKRKDRKKKDRKKAEKNKFEKKIQKDANPPGGSTGVYGKIRLSLQKQSVSESTSPDPSRNHQPNGTQNRESQRQTLSSGNSGHSHPGLYFYKGISGHDFGSQLVKRPLNGLMGLNTTLTTATLQGIAYEDYFIIPNAEHGFTLETIYPGLLIGTGYTHPVPAGQENQFQMGHSFDWTTGIPVIPGSTVKGVLRSVFHDVEKSKNPYAPNYIFETLGEKYKPADQDPKVFIRSLENELFDGGGAVFHEAYISKLPSDGKLFADDYITPHGSVFENPTPFRFLKIAPGVCFTFQFRLRTFHIGESSVTVEEKDVEQMFKQMLLDFGVGALRNKGYGAFKEILNA